MTIEHWLENNPTKTGEINSERMMNWICSTQKKLLRAFPKSERRFCKVVDCLKKRLPHKWRGRLHYTRQKWFIVDPLVIFFGDFYFRNLKLLVEIDGREHSGPAAKEKDIWRSKLISTFRGTKVARITNDRLEVDGFTDVEKWLVSEFIGALPSSVSVRLQRDYHAVQREFPLLYSA